MGYELWRDLAAAYVCVVARVHGWRVLRVRRSGSTSSVYVVLRLGRRRADVRLSDHPPGRGASRRGALFSVLQRSTGELDALPAFLAARAVRRP